MVSGGGRPKVVSLADVAAMAGVSRPAVSNWRRRYPDFPKPVDESGAVALFAAGELRAWMVKHGKRFDQPSLDQSVWSLVSAVRGTATVDDAVQAGVQFAALEVLADQLGFSKPSALPESLYDPTHAEPLVQALGVIVRAATENNVAEPDMFNLTRVDIEASAPVLSSVAGLLRAHSPVEVVEELITAGQQRQGLAGPATSTPDSLAALLVELAGSIRGKVLDPACGLATTLLTAYRHRQSEHAVTLVGYEQESAVWRMAKQRLLVHGAGAADVQCQDGLGKAVGADIVFADPPLAARDDAGRRVDAAWLRSSVNSLSSTGRAFHISGAGLLFHGQTAGEERRRLIQQGCVEAVIELPAGLYFGSGVSLAVWCLRPAGISRREVLLIDATELGKRERKLTALAAADISEIVTCYRSWLEDNEPAGTRIAYATVSIAELLDENANLRPGRWVSQLSVNDRIAVTASAAHRASTAMTAVNNTKPFTLPALTGDSTRPTWTIDKLEKDGLIALSRGTTLPRDLADDGILPVVRPQDLHANWQLRPTKRINPTDLDSEEIRTQAGDVLLAPNRAGVRAAVDDKGGNVASQLVWILRPRQGWLPPIVLAALLSSEHNQRPDHAGRIRDLEIPQLTSDEAQWLASTLQQLVDQQRKLAEATTATNELTHSLINALDAGARMSPNTAERHHP